MKSLSKNAFYNVIYKCLNVVFPLITMAYVSRILLPAGVGKVASAQNFVTYFILIASLGLPTYGVKVIASYCDDRNKSSKAFSELFIINGISTILCSILYVIMILSVDYFHTKILISMIVGIQLFANIINIDWLYQGFEEYRYITIRSTIVKVLGLIAIFVFVKNQNDYIIYAFITATSLVANFVMNMLKLNSFVSFKLNELNITQHIKPVLALLASTIAIEIYVLGGTTMLSIIKGDEDVAYYTYATKAISVVRTFIVAICAVFLPRLNYYISHHQIDNFNNLSSKGIKIILNLCIPAAIGLYVLADDFVLLLFGFEYISVIPLLKILCISLVTIALSNFTGYQILVSLGKEKIVLYSTIIGAIINLSINYFLIPSFGCLGAAIAAVITEGVIAIYQYYYVKIYTVVKIDVKELICKIIPSLIFMIMIILILKRFIDNIIIEISVSLVIGFISYSYASIKFKNDFLFMVIEKLKIRNKLKGLFKILGI